MTLSDRVTDETRQPSIFTPMERQKMQRVLNALRAKRKLAFTREHVWVL